MSAVAGLAAGCGSNKAPIAAPPSVNTLLYKDADYLNFALNLEYLEAEFYLRAATGVGLTSTDAGTGAGAVTGGAQVPFKTPAIQAYALEIAAHELAHVQFLRSALGSAAVARPAIDFTNAFNAAYQAASGNTSATFNPFADETSFVLGAFVFEDVGVTAYNGAGPLLTDKTTNLAAAGSIVAVEAYHAGLVRDLLVYLDDGTAMGTIATANAIAALRGKASSVANTSGSATAETTLSAGQIVNADTNSLAFARSTDQILHIVYLNATAGAVSKGGFFPSGLNGSITASNS